MPPGSAHKIAMCAGDLDVKARAYRDPGYYYKWWRDPYFLMGKRDMMQAFT